MNPSVVLRGDRPFLILLIPSGGWMMMSTKLIACVLAALVVAVGGVFLYTGKTPCSLMHGSCSSTDLSCDSGSECSLEKTGTCCALTAVASEGDCCETTKVAVKKKACCCEGEKASLEPITAAFGGAAGVK